MNSYQWMAVSASLEIQQQQQYITPWTGTPKCTDLTWKPDNASRVLSVPTYTLAANMLFLPKTSLASWSYFFNLSRMDFNNVPHTPSGVELSCSTCTWTCGLTHRGFLFRRTSCAYQLHSVVMSSLLCLWLWPHQITPKTSKKQMKFELEFSRKRIQWRGIKLFWAAWLLLFWVTVSEPSI